MLWFFYILVFIISASLLYLSGEWVVTSLMRTARFLGWQEFIAAFFIMAVGASLPNLFVGVTSATRGIPSLSLGDVLGNNLVALTLAVALGVLFAPKKEIPIGGRIVRATAFFTVLAAVIPLLLIADGILGRGDGLILLGLFVFYTSWLFAKKEHFASPEAEGGDLTAVRHNLKSFFKDFLKIIAGIALLLMATQGIVQAASFFAAGFNVPLIFIGVLIVGFGNALPETYFSVAAARRGDTWLILGNLMGSVVVPATLVLGIVALIKPIEILSNTYSWEILILSRTFVILAALTFFIFARTNWKITAREAYILGGVYLVFIIMAFLFLR